MMVPRRRRRGRIGSRGTVMVLFMVLTVVILGIIGLVIEIGLVRVNRERMQSAADSTALEILRERDYVPPGASFADDMTRDHSRRDRNRHVASWAFSEELLPEYSGESEAGGGAYVKMSSLQGGAGNPMHTGLVIEEIGEGIPILRTNYSGSVGSGTALNERRGDIVAGHFTGHDPNAVQGHDENPLRRESPDYERVDFELPDDPSQAPYSDSVLVRLRKTKPYGLEAVSPWDDDIQDISSTGYTRPLIFGLGSSFLGQEPGTGYSVRHHGVPMRATSIAQARPATRIGGPSADPQAPEAWRIGAGPMVIRWAEWNSDATWELDPSTGTYSAVLRVRPPDYEVVSVLHDSFVAGFLYPKRGAQVGDLIDRNALQPDLQGGTDMNLDPSYWEVEECYVPLYLFGTSTEWRICGFARVRTEQIDPPDNCPECELGDLFIRMTKLPNTMSPGEPWIAPRNASATFDGSQPESVFPGNPQRDWDDLIERLFQRSLSSGDPLYVFESRVYAPAHVR